MNLSSGRVTAGDWGGGFRKSSTLLFARLGGAQQPTSHPDPSEWLQGETVETSAACRVKFCSHDTSAGGSRKAVSYSEGRRPVTLLNVPRA